MQFDSRDDRWTPADDREARLQSPWALTIALALIALTSAALIAGPTGPQQGARPAVAGIAP